ncbi:DUF1883 domain-containing protein [Hoeflea ulvae]|uniref:diguanylate cyclase n=1 Tax=Hoeflea ulvae TaxID=2983764 RepID=A0ABT3YI59_9HYPH|nr:DUF1883 domain-containing protein [Hoeflea ulvae]MCY0095415.1 DUF1883 domain-containing protein [Hoeflea ulvae]
MPQKIGEGFVLGLSPRYKCYHLGKQAAGTVVEVVLSCVNNVRLMDHANFLLYSEGKTFQFIGGRTEKSPARLAIPRTANWHIVVDRVGFQALSDSNVRTIPPKGAKPAAPLLAPGTGNAAPAAAAGSQAARPTSEADVLTRMLNELNTYKQIANTDSLTGLANRRAFDARMTQIFSDPKNLAGTALILTDIDHFKSFNDRFGHLVGDRILKSVAEAIRGSLPKAAFSARTGGEEFGIIVQVTSPDDAFDIAELARRAVESTSFTHQPGATEGSKITISLGLCMAGQSLSLEDLYIKADLALYGSKNDGRNRTSVYQDDMQDNSTPA